MSFFSPVTARARSTRLLYLTVYALLAIGAVSVVIPLVLTIAGAMAGQYDARTLSFYPEFLVNRRALEARYVDAKYSGDLQNLRMAWGEPEADFYGATLPRPADPASLMRWQEFLAHRPALKPAEAGLAFTRASKREAAIENRNFRRWLVAQYDGELKRLSADLLIQVSTATNLLPPRQSRISQPTLENPLQRKFEDYLSSVPPAHRLVWNVGNFFRAVYLPRTYGLDLARYNALFGTHYISYQEVPFSAAAPDIGAAAWFNFVQRLLNPEFIELTPKGQSAWAASGMARNDFIRTRAQPMDLRVASLDLEYAAWAAARGISDARIPQRAIDWAELEASPARWRARFAWQNFGFVLDEIAVQGNALRNTIILIFLTVLGALTINPMAAYALSRYKPRQSYYVLLAFMATIAFPAEILMIPNFLQLKELGLLNTFGALVLPGLVNGFSIFLLKGFFDSLPQELFEAADLDGASEWQVFWGLTMNLSKPILAVIALNAFISAYGAFFFALILAPDQRMWTLMVWMYQMRQTAGPGIVCASLLVTAIPTLIVYLCAQNVILRGLVVPTEK